MAFQIIRNDITKVKADAIVNTANPRPVCGSGTDYAIYQAAGAEQLLEARKKIGNIARGQAVETPAFDLPAKYIIHTVGPSWEGGDKGEYDILMSCYENSLQLALKLKCRSIAFPLIATGVYGFPKDKALQAALAVIQPFVMEHDMTVILVVFGDKAFQLSGSVVDHVREYVDSHYVEEACREEYSMGAAYPGNANIPPEERELLRRRRMRKERETALTEEPAAVDSAIETDDAMPAPQHMLSSAVKVGAKPKAAAPKAAGIPVPVKEKVDYGKIIVSLDKTFQEKLFEYIDGRGLTGPKVYKDYISKQVYSKILSDKNYHPNKSTAILLSLSLHLSLEETKDLIGRAGWALSPSSKTDMVIAGCIQNGVYKLMDVDLILFDYNCPTLSEMK